MITRFRRLTLATEHRHGPAARAYLSRLLMREYTRRHQQHQEV